MEDKIIIGVPVHNDLTYFKMMVESLFKSTDTHFLLLVIESESTDGSREYSDALNAIYPSRDIEIIHTKKEGPLKAYNKLFDIATERKCNLLLTQTDVVFPRLVGRDWLNEFIYLGKKEEIGAVVTLNGGGYSGPRYVKDFMWAGAWCTYIPYTTLKEIGKYDENFILGDAVDIDWSYRISKAGKRIQIANYWVDHHWQTAHDNEAMPHEELERIKKANGVYFRKKHKLQEFENENSNID